MKTLSEIDISSRKHAAYLLAEKLTAHKNSDARIIAIPNGGAPVGFWIAKQLNLNFNVMPCRPITLPGKDLEIIGSISVDDISIRADMEGIPQSFVYSQIQMIKKEVENEFTLYNTIKPCKSLRGVTVMLVDDVLLHSDTMIACVHSIRKQKPQKIIAAIPFVTANAASAVAKEVDELIFLYQDQHPQQVRDRIGPLPKVSRETVKSLLMNSKELCIPELTI